MTNRLKSTGNGKLRFTQADHVEVPTGEEDDEEIERFEWSE